MKANNESELSQYCKENCGLDAKQVADYAQIPRRTFYDWWKSRRKTVELIVIGVKYDPHQNNPTK